MASNANRYAMPLSRYLHRTGAKLVLDMFTDCDMLEAVVLDNVGLMLFEPHVPRNKSLTICIKNDETRCNFTSK